MDHIIQHYIGAVRKSRDCFFGHFGPPPSPLWSNVIFRDPLPLITWFGPDPPPPNVKFFFKHFIICLHFNKSLLILKVPGGFQTVHRSKFSEGASIRSCYFSKVSDMKTISKTSEIFRCFEWFLKDFQENFVTFMLINKN